METAVIQSNSKANMKLLIELAKKIGVTVKSLSEEDKEDLGQIKAIMQGRTGKFIDTESFLEKIKK